MNKPDANSQQTPDVIESPGVGSAVENLPHFSNWLEEFLGFRIPELPRLPQTIKNFDKMVGALLDWPTAMLEAKSTDIRATTARDMTINNAIIEAAARELQTSNDQALNAVVRGLVREHIRKLRGRRKVVEVAAEEIGRNKANNVDATTEVSEEFLAFFNGKVDSIGTKQAQILFGKLLAGELQAPGSFSKQSMSILSEMDARTGKIFETICNMSIHNPKMEDVGFLPRVYTIDMEGAGQNGLSEFGLDFNSLSALIEAGLINPNLYTNAGFPSNFEMAGVWRKLVLIEKFSSPNETEEALQAARDVLSKNHSVVLFTRAGRELRTIVSKHANEKYMEKLVTALKKRKIKMELST